MTKLYFKKTQRQELINFIAEIVKNSKIITINNVTFYDINCNISCDDGRFLDVRDKQKYIICSIPIHSIKSINEYKIIKEEE